MESAGCASAVRRPPERSLQHGELIRVASKYPHIAKDYFYNKKFQTVEIIKLNGSVELAPIVGLSEVIVDIVETGSTLRANGLEVLEEICDLSARMVVNQVSLKMEQERIRRADPGSAGVKGIIRRSRCVRKGETMRVVKIDKETTENILSDLLKRSPNQYDSYADSVQEILDAVKERGDEALFDYTEKFDGCRLTPETIQVTEAGDCGGL